MLEYLIESNIAIVGGGGFCKNFIAYLLKRNPEGRKPLILGVLDKNLDAPGIKFANESGIYITDNFAELYQLENLQVILELTNDPALIEEIGKNKPPEVKMIDHFQARAIWDFFQVEDVKKKGKAKLREVKNDPDAVEDIFDELTENLTSILRYRNIREYRTEMELLEHERAESQVVQGSTIPTFVINREHIVTHWNKAMERFSGVKAEEVVGTNKQWLPFYDEKRPTMADIILDRIDDKGIKKYYGTKWRKSTLIDGACESEAFFPKLGDAGKWCWFTAVPIKAPDGTIVGAIETLWDKTEDKKAEDFREKRTKELSALCSIYSALSAPKSLDKRIISALREIKKFLPCESICVFLLDENDNLRFEYNYGDPDNFCEKRSIICENSIIYQVAESGELTIYENLSDETAEECEEEQEKNLKSWTYIPISAKEKKAFGVIRIASKNSYKFKQGEKNVLELIGNRIGVAIENYKLQEQYIKSEEQYRSLFDNDPNPIFIINSENFTIMDSNQRALDCYGYLRQEMIGLSFIDLSDDDDDEVKNGLKDIFHDQSVFFPKKRHCKKGGKPFFVNINVSSASYGEHDVLIATTTDITETVEKETQLIQAGKMTTLGVMAAGMAHEINQPLNVIQICADYFLKMLKRGKSVSDDDLKTMATDIVTNVERATGVIKHVRNFARQSEVVHKKININDPINDIFKVMGHQLKVHQVEVELDLAPDLPFIKAEHNRLEQVFINLVTNAIDAMDEKCSKPEKKKAKKLLTIKSFVEDDNYVAVNVSDTGTGMPKEVIDKIIEPFYTTKEVGKGTGLGVSISYGIVKDYHGKIEIQSEVGKGTVFMVRFPALTQEA